jgi:hypothetical protein
VLTVKIVRKTKFCYNFLKIPSIWQLKNQIYPCLIIIKLLFFKKKIIKVAKPPPSLMMGWFSHPNDKGVARKASHGWPQATPSPWEVADPVDQQPFWFFFFFFFFKEFLYFSF